MSFQLCTTKEFLWALGMGTSLVLGLRKNGFSSLRKVTSCGQNMMSFHAISFPAPIFKLFFIRSSQAVNSNWIRSIEWSLRAFASMRIVCLFLRAREVVKFFLRAASTLDTYRWRAASTLDTYRWRAASTLDTYRWRAASTLDTYRWQAASTLETYRWQVASTSSTS